MHILNFVPGTMYPFEVNFKRVMKIVPAAIYPILEGAPSRITSHYGKKK